MQSEAQRTKERRELEERVSIRQALLEKKVCKLMARLVNVIFDSLLDGTRETTISRRKK